MKQSKVVAISAAALAGLVLGAGALGQAQQKINLDFWAHWGSAQRRPTIEKIVNAWNKAHPNVQVTYTFVPADQIITKTLAGVAAGNPPDAVVIDIRTSKFRAAKNQATDLTALGANSVKDKYFPNLWETGTYNGRQYALPFNTDTRMLFYNKAQFREVGLDPNRPPRSWAELEQYAAKLDKKDGDNYVRVGFHPLFGGMGYEGWVQNAGAFFFDKAYEEANVNNPTAISTLQWVKKWTDKMGTRNYMAVKSATGGSQGLFLSGRVSMMVENANLPAAINLNAPDLDYGMVPVPTPNGKQHPNASWGGGFNVEVPRGTKHPKEAYAFAVFLTTEGARIWAKEQFGFPGAKAAVAGNSDPAFLKMAANMKNTWIAPAPVYAQTYGNAINKAVDDVILRDVEPKKALDEAQTAVAKLVADGKR